MKEKPDFTATTNHSTESVSGDVKCGHHWLIESPHGPTSWGICKHCGDRREFSNSATDALWDGEGIPAASNRNVAHLRRGSFDNIFTGRNRREDSE